MGEVWQKGYQDRVDGQKPAERKDPYWDGWLTADAEAGHCTMMCQGPPPNLEPLSEDDPPGMHHEGCGMRFKGSK